MIWAKRAKILEEIFESDYLSTERKCQKFPLDFGQKLPTNAVMLEHRKDGEQLPEPKVPEEAPKPSKRRHSLGGERGNRYDRRETTARPKRAFSRKTKRDQRRSGRR